MDKLHEILEYSVGNFTVGKILSAVVAFVVCYLLMRLVVRLFDRLLARFSLDATLQKILKAVVRLILWFVTAMIVIETLGVSVTSLLAAFSVVGLAASLAVQDSLSNCAGGIRQWRKTQIPPRMNWNSTSLRSEKLFLRTRVQNNTVTK